MKCKILKLVVICFGSCLFNNGYGQVAPPDDRKENWSYFKDYSNDQKDVIRKYWKQYFQDDINRKIAPTVSMLPVKFDSYGSLYPNVELLKTFDAEDFNPVDREDTDNRAYSMFDIFKNNKEKVTESLKNISNSEDKAFYTQILKIKYSYANDSLFYGPWDRYHGKKTLAALNEKISVKEKAGKKVSVLFFVHGFNVPYSLANIQAIELVKLLAKSNVDTSAIVVVPVFWPSHAGKDCLIEDRDHFSTENNTKVNNGGPANAFGFWHYSNRAYFAGIGLRKLINGISSSSAQVLVFSHSLGATVATTAFINTYSKLDTDFTKERNEAKSAKIFFDACKDRLLIQEDVNYAILDEMLKVHLPERKARIFMSAAAIPGQATFRDMDASCESKCKFYIPINPNDEMLNKDVAPLGLGSPYRFGVTTLGLNMDNDALLTQRLYFKDPANFCCFPDTILNVDHDILTYMRQPAYINCIVKFFNEK